MKLTSTTLKATLIASIFSMVVAGLGITSSPALAASSESLQDIIDSAQAYADSIEVFGVTFKIPNGWNCEINSEMEETEDTIFYKFSSDDYSFLGIFYDLTDIYEFDEINELNQLDPDLYGEDIAKEFGTTYIDSLSYRNDSTSFTLLFLTGPQGAPGNIFAFALINGTRPVEVAASFYGYDLESILPIIDEFYSSIEPARITYAFFRTLGETLISGK